MSLRSEARRCAGKGEAVQGETLRQPPYPLQDSPILRPPWSGRHSYLSKMWLATRPSLDTDAAQGITFAAFRMVPESGLEPLT